MGWQLPGDVPQQLEDGAVSVLFRVELLELVEHHHPPPRPQRRDLQVVEALGWGRVAGRLPSGLDRPQQSGSRIAVQGLPVDAPQIPVRCQIGEACPQQGGLARTGFAHDHRQPGLVVVQEANQLGQFHFPPQATEEFAVLLREGQGSLDRGRLYRLGIRR